MGAAEVAADDDARGGLGQKAAVGEDGGDVSAQAVIFQHIELPWVFGAG